jgi:hypothetical protein
MEKGRMERRGQTRRGVHGNRTGLIERDGVGEGDQGLWDKSQVSSLSKKKKMMLLTKLIWGRDR